MERIPMSCGYGIFRKRTMTLPEKVLIASYWMSENMRTLQEVSSVSKGNGDGVLEFKCYRLGEKVEGIRLTSSIYQSLQIMNLQFIYNVQ